MQASITNWRIAEAYRAEEGIPSVLLEPLRQHQDTFRRLGLLDITLIRSSRETITVVTMYDDDLDREATLAEQNRTFGPTLEGKLELISREYGPAYDTTDMLG